MEQNSFIDNFITPCSDDGLFKKCLGPRTRRSGAKRIEPESGKAPE